MNQAPPWRPQVGGGTGRPPPGTWAPRKLRNRPGKPRSTPPRSTSPRSPRSTSPGKPRSTLRTWPAAPPGEPRRKPLLFLLPFLSDIVSSPWRGAAWRGGSDARLPTRMENRHETPELKDTELVLDNVDAHHLNRCEINPPSPQNEERGPTPRTSKRSRVCTTTTAPHQKPETPTLTSNDRRLPMRPSADIATTDLAKRYSYYNYTHDASTTYDTRATNNKYHVDVAYATNDGGDAHNAPSKTKCPPRV